jgi:hypothetical protein
LIRILAIEGHHWSILTVSEKSFLIENLSNEDKSVVKKLTARQEKKLLDDFLNKWSSSHHIPKFILPENKIDEAEMRLFDKGKF